MRLTYDDLTPSVVIAVGGATLSRGLTLEGLSVSYFLRTTGQYDTLLQMGRGSDFGKAMKTCPRVGNERNGGRFRFLALVEAELRSRIAEMNNEGSKPETWQQIILQHPTMTVTAANKMGAAGIDVLRKRGRQTFLFDVKNEERLQSNNQAARDLVRNFSTRRSTVSILRSTSGYSVTCQKDVIDFVSSYHLDDAQRHAKELMLRYLEGRLTKPPSFGTLR